MLNFISILLFVFSTWTKKWYSNLFFVCDKHQSIPSTVYATLEAEIGFCTASEL
jgi:hypothetical protein